MTDKLRSYGVAHRERHTQHPLTHGLMRQNLIHQQGCTVRHSTRTTVNKETKSEQESRLLEIVRETDTELVILARYMQILSNNLCEQLAGRYINIHHSFLPGFKGARPYHLVLGERLNFVGKLGLSIGFAGIVLMTFPESLAPTRGNSTIAVFYITFAAQAFYAYINALEALYLIERVRPGIR